MSNKYHTIGLMSGTSLDGLDIAYCEFWKDENQWHYNLLHTKTLSYPPELHKKLENSIHITSLALCLLDIELGKFFGKHTQEFLSSYKLKPDFICSHGHTVFHQPDKGFTSQIGSGQEIANLTGCNVYCDFRSKDVSAGGQGAPLVPIGDRLLFKDFDYRLNLGGFSNISFEEDNTTYAYDISPVNILLNHLSQLLGKDYDDKGTIARSGQVNPELLDLLNQLRFYRQEPPKSLGKEWFEKEMLPLLKNAEDKTENLLHTSVLHIADQIAASIGKHRKKASKILVTGGGAYNLFLIEELKKRLHPEDELIVPEKKLIDFKEALIFGFLGVLRSRNEANCLSSVTGAFNDVSAGVLYTPAT